MFTPRLQKVYCSNAIEVLPGDAFNERAETFARTQPMIAPTFAKINAAQEAFFVPGWQLFEHFDDFITGGERGDYNDKLPFFHVGDLYGTIANVLTFGWYLSEDSGTLADWFDTNLDSHISYIRYNQALECVQCIIEHCDLLRSCPLVLPDFVQASGSSFKSVFQSNFTAFSSKNSIFASSELRINYLPFGAYLKTYCEYYRDENLCEDYFDTIWKNNNDYGNGDSSFVLYNAVGYVPLTYVIDPAIVNDWDTWDEVGPYVFACRALLGVLPRAWKKDYFTSALPFTQKGPDVLIPLSGTFPVDFTGTSSIAAPSRTVFANKVSAAGSNVPVSLATAGAGEGEFDPVKGSVTLDNSGLASTITDLRRAFRLEEFFEADARGGNRYPENTMVQFGVRTPDTRLPRAMFLGSNTQPVQISEVVQTSSTASQPTPQGTLAGKGISYGSNRLCKGFFTLHGILLNMFTLRVNAIYEAGIHPMFSRYDRTEYAWPRFANLGEQPIYDKQLFVNNYTTEDGVFGYTPRYAEYKAELSSVHGLLKGSLNYWTMSRRFGAKPVLNEEFIYNPPRLDNFAVTNPLQPPFIVEIDYRVRSSRLLPFFGVPTL